MEYTRSDETGRLQGTGKYLKKDADIVFLASGQKMSNGPFDMDMKMVGGKLYVDENGATSVPGIWAGGDCVSTGEDLTVHAVEQGKQAAISMDRWLRNS